MGVTEKSQREVSTSHGGDGVRCRILIVGFGNMVGWRRGNLAVRSWTSCRIPFAAMPVSVGMMGSRDMCGCRRPDRRPMNHCLPSVPARGVRNIRNAAPSIRRQSPTWRHFHQCAVGVREDEPFPYDEALIRRDAELETSSWGSLPSGVGACRDLSPELRTVRS
jgi:hypothetical protein